MGPVLTVLIEVLAESIHERNQHLMGSQFRLPSWADTTPTIRRLSRHAAAARVTEGRQGKPQQDELPLVAS